MPMLQKIRDLSFTTKIISAFIFSLLLGIGLNTFEQINTSVTTLEREKIESLDMLTEQVALNFSDSQDSLSDSTYARLRAFEIPALMNDYINQPESGTSALQYALAQTVSESTEYDFVALEAANGLRLSTALRSPMSTYRYREVRDFALGLFDDQPQNRFSQKKWFRAEDGGVYIMANVYNTSPLKWVGRAVFHIKGSVFSVSETYGDTGFAFFDSDGSYLIFAGMEADEERRTEIVQELESSGSVESGIMDSGDFFISESSSGGWTAVGLSSKTAYRQMRSDIIRVGLTYGCVGLFAGITLLILLMQNLVGKLKRIRKSMDEVSEGNLDSHIEITDNDNISRMAVTFNHMTDRVRELMDEVAEKERQKKDAELQILEYKYRSLETQIRPHFIYNAFEIVNAMAKIKGETEIVEIVQRISRYFRNITVNTTKQFITTQQEFDALQDYTEIYRFIHGDRLTVTFSAREAARNAMIPTMIVQPVVENALKHGMRNRNEDSQIIVHAYIKENKLNLTVKDTGYGLTPEQVSKLANGEQLSDPHHGGIGLGNVRQRLELIYGGDADFTISNRPEGGVVVKIIIPLTYSEPNLRYEEDSWEFDD